MKKIILIGAIVILTSCAHDTKYKIVDSIGDSHYTNLYTKGSDGCIKFQELCGCEEGDDLQNVTLCGSYTITENKSYRP